MKALNVAMIIAVSIFSFSTPIISMDNDMQKKMTDESGAMASAVFAGGCYSRLLILLDKTAAADVIGRRRFFLLLSVYHRDPVASFGYESTNPPPSRIAKPIFYCNY